MERFDFACTETGLRKDCTRIEIVQEKNISIFNNPQKYDSSVSKNHAPPCMKRSTSSFATCKSQNQTSKGAENSDRKQTDAQQISVDERNVSRSEPQNEADFIYSKAVVKKCGSANEVYDSAIKKFSVFSNGQISKTLLRSGFTVPELRAVCEYLGRTESDDNSKLASLGKEALVQLALLRVANDRPSALAPACVNSQAPSKKRKDLNCSMELNSKRCLQNMNATCVPGVKTFDCFNIFIT